MARPVAADEDGALGQQEVQHVGELAQVAAAVVPHVKDQRLRPLLPELGDGLLQPLGAVVVEVEQAHIAHLSLQHPALHRVVLQLGPLHLHGAGRPVLPQHLQGDGGARLPLDKIRALIACLSRQGDAVHSGNDLPGFQSSRLGGAPGLHSEDIESLLPCVVDGNPNPHILVGAALVLGLQLISRQVVAPAVAQAGHHALQGGVHHLCLVIFPHKEGVDQPQPLHQGTPTLPHPGTDGQESAAQHGSGGECNGQQKLGQGKTFLSHGIRSFPEKPARAEADASARLWALPAHSGRNFHSNAALPLSGHYQGWVRLRLGNLLSGSTRV